ncbi:post-GPI attachment to proteins factor 6-like [Palaemon carinicauda]|uniref:post-GPI attachment to proteins factor 6-like n=1 Tax=Palaemon carinicauda TaxID=392227 RepID=UPI0035B6407F
MMRSHCSWSSQSSRRRIVLPGAAASCFSILCLITFPTVAQSENAATFSPNGGTVLYEELAGRQVYVYGAYKDVQIFHFLIPPHISSAIFNFTANDTQACTPRNLSIFLQPHSYPVVNPDGSEYPSGFWVNRSEVYKLDLKSDLKPAFLSVPFPEAGDWFMIAFISETSNRITQAGLFPSCHSWLRVKAKYVQQEQITNVVPEIHSHQDIQFYQKINGSQYYRFYVPSATWLVVVNISNCFVLKEAEDNSACFLDIAFRTRGLPNPESSDTVIHKCEGPGNTCTLEVIPEEENWHYLQLETHHHLVELNLAVQLFMCDGAEGASLLSRFDIKESCPENESVTNPLLMNITDMEREDAEVSGVENDGANPSMSLQSRRILFMPAVDSERQLLDSCWPRHSLVKKTFGGNFVFEYDLPPDENGTVPLVINISNGIPTMLTFSLESIIDIGGTLSVELAVSPFMNISAHNFSVAGCLSRGIRETPNVDWECSRGYGLLVNTTRPSAIATQVLIPFPEPGPWYLTLYPECFLYNASDIVDCTVNETTIIFGVSSASCLQGKCGKYGSCYQYISGGFIFSTCVCEAGYRGWGCTDSSQATSNWELLLATLLLTLSNLFFLPAVILALKRRYFAEATVYAFTMVFSTFYHACDQEPYNFCIMRLSVMQFCDFYSAIFSFWVTLIVMADLPHSLYSLLHVAGAMVVALGVEYDRTGLWVFVVPSVSAFFIMITSWIWHCKKDKSCYPAKGYWLTCLLPGVLLAASGLICYAFLETHDNYYYVHSAWHATMALAILCLLPPRREKNGMNFTYQPNCNFCT